MNIDIYQSRRLYNEICRWWSHDERDQFPSNEIVFKREPTGYFWAKEENAEQNRGNVVGGVFLLDSSRITIKSPDNLDKIQSEDLVEYRGELWIVVSVQKTKARIQQTMFANDKYCSHFWYVELRK